MCVCIYVCIYILNRIEHIYGNKKGYEEKCVLIS